MFIWYYVTDLIYYKNISLFSCLLFRGYLSQLILLADFSAFFFFHYWKYKGKYSFTIATKYLERRRWLLDIFFIQIKFSDEWNAKTAIVRALPSRIQIWYSDGTSPNEFIVRWIRAKRCTYRRKYDVGTTRTPAVSWQYCNGIDEIEFIYHGEIFEFINKTIFRSEFGGNFSVISNSITIVVVTREYCGIPEIDYRGLIRRGISSIYLSRIYWFYEKFIQKI